MKKITFENFLLNWTGEEKKCKIIVADSVLTLLCLPPSSLAFCFAWHVSHSILYPFALIRS